MTRSSLSAFLLVVLAIGRAATAQIIYVDSSATGKGDGSSWVHAYPDLAVALAAARSGEVWIAAGRYRLTNKTASFHLPSDVAVFGGFSGTETDRAQRDPAANRTILSGDVLGDDQPGGVNRTDNAEHVVRGAGLGGASVLDGVEVTGGESTANGAGAGIELSAASLTVRNCRVLDNRASWGGGISASGSGLLRVEDSVIAGNYVHLYRGAGVHVGRGCTARLVRTEVRDNTIRSGVTHGNGAGLYADPQTVVELLDCVFANNIVDFRFGGTGYPPSGGALTFLGTSLTIERCQLIGNQAPTGGAIYTYGPTVIRDSVLAGNRALRAFDIGGWGGALVATSTATLDGSVVAGNSATEDGGGVYATQSTSLVDCIVWNNTDRHGQVGESQVKGTSQRYCCIMNFLTPRQGEDPVDPKKFPFCILTDPRFVGAGDYHLVAGSPCIDAGDPSRVRVGRDLGGMPRILDGDLDGRWAGDMGAHEFGNIQLAAQWTRTSTTLSLRLSTSGRPGLATLVAFGLPSAGVPLAPWGILLLDPSVLVFAPMAPVPSALTIGVPLTSIPPGGWDLRAQALGSTAGTGNLSNPVELQVRAP